MQACIHCSFQCCSKLLLVKHEFEAHSTEANFRRTCDINGCPLLFRSYGSFLSHANRKHPNWKEDLEAHAIRSDSTASHTGIADSESVGVVTDSVPGDPGDDVLSDSGPGDSGDGDSEPDDSDGDSEPDDSGDGDSGDNLETYDPNQQTLGSETTNTDLQRTAALFLLTLKEKFKLTQTAVDFAMSSVKTMMDLVTSNAVHPFSGLETEYLQNNYYRNYFDLVVSSCTCESSALNIFSINRSQ